MKSAGILLFFATLLFSAAPAGGTRAAEAPPPPAADERRKLESEAVKALLTALSAYERQPAAEGAAGLRAFQKLYAETEIVRRAELQRDLVRKQFPKLAEESDTVEGLARAAEEKAASQCPVCAGSGRDKCATCKGTGTGSCPDCAGTGQARCGVCAGTARLTCPTCYGAGRYRGDGTLGYAMERTCPTCNGYREVACDVCTGTGKRTCKRCAGAGRLAGGCAACAGKGAAVCRTCEGSGMRPLSLFAWGPPPARGPEAINVAGPGARWRAWQGECSGGVITLVGAEVLYRASAGRIAGLASGKKLRVFAAALDNRKGTKLLRFRPAEKMIRAVTDDHAQVDAVDLAKLLAVKEGAAAAPGAAQAAAMAAHAGDADCLPGAYQCVLGAFPEGTDPEKIGAVYFLPGGTTEPVKLSPIWLADDEVADLRRSLREK